MIAGIPIFAILKIICTRIFRWIKRNSHWYEDNEAEDKVVDEVIEGTDDSDKIHK